MSDIDVRQIIRESLLLEYLGINKESEDLVDRAMQVCQEAVKWNDKNPNEKFRVENLTDKIEVRVEIKHESDFEGEVQANLGWFDGRVLYVVIVRDEDGAWDQYEIYNTIMHELTHSAQERSGEKVPSKTQRAICTLHDDYEGFRLFLHNNGIVHGNDKFLHSVIKMLQLVIYICQPEEQDAFIAGAYAYFDRQAKCPSFIEFIQNGCPDFKRFDMCSNCIKNECSEDLIHYVCRIYRYNLGISHFPLTKSALLEFIQENRRRFINKAKRTYYRLYMEKTGNGDNLEDYYNGRK